MKKYLAILVVAILALTISFVGCKTTTAAETTAADETTAAAETKPIVIGHMTFHTGPFSHIGEPFDQALKFTVDIINQNPPLPGREITIINQDQGGIGEGACARQLTDADKVDILMNVGMDYLTYRDWLMQYISDNNRPFLPSVHGGSIDPQYGGTVAEPIFRGAPQDSDQGVAAIVRAVDAGAKNCVIMAVEIDGYQTMKNTAAKAAEITGLEVLDTIDMEPEGSYRSETARAQGANPDALIVFADAADTGLIVKTAAELGMSVIILGGTDMLFEDFPNTATMEAIQKHKLVQAINFTYAETPAWDYFQPAWDGDPESVKFNDATLCYTQQYYDVVTCTALAIKKAGSTGVSDLVPAMREVAMGPGTKVYTYKEGFDLLEKGEAIDFDGATGSFDYTDTGVVSGNWGVVEWTDATTMTRVAIMDGKSVLDVSSQIK